MLAEDLHNPLGLDYPGLNFAETLQRDEQVNQNRREYLNLKRTVDKYTLHTTHNEQLRRENRRNKFAVPAYFDVAKDDEIDAVSEDEAYGPVRIVRTMQMPSNAIKWTEESLRRENASTKLVRQAIATEEETLQKSEVKNEFIEYDIMLNDLSGINDSLGIIADEVDRPSEPQNRDRRKRIYPQNFGEFECMRKEMTANSKTINEKFKIAAKYCANGKTSTLKIVEETILEESDPVVIASLDSCAADTFDRDDFGLCVGLEKDSRIYRLEGFRNPIRTNLQPKSFDDDQNVVSTCKTRDEWFAEILPQRIRKIQRSRSIERVDQAISQQNSVAEKNFAHETTQPAEEIEYRLVIDKPRRKQIVSYFNENIQTDPPSFTPNEADSELPELRSFAEDGFFTTNLSRPKDDITKTFKIRRHRHHKDHTKHKEAMVFYQPKKSTGIREPDEPSTADIKTKSPPDKGFEKEKLVSELIQRQNSIDACESSEFSSVGSNYSQQSGSEIYFDNVRMPLRHLTKSYEPYEEANRVGVKAIRLHDRKESEEAYFKVPYPGQLQDMKKLANKKVGKKVRPPRTPSKRDTAHESDIMDKFIYFPKKRNVRKLIDNLREMARSQFTAAIYECNQRKLPQMTDEWDEQEMEFELTNRHSGDRDSQLMNRLPEAKTLENQRMAFERECECVKLRTVEDEKCMRESLRRLKCDWLNRDAYGSLTSVEEWFRKRYDSHMRPDLTEYTFDFEDFDAEEYSRPSREEYQKILTDAERFLRRMEGLNEKQIMWKLLAMCRSHESIAPTICSEFLGDVIANVLSKFKTGEQ